MKIIIIIITCTFFFLSCSKKTSTDQNSSPVLSGLSDSSFEESPLHPDLLKAWNIFTKRMDDKIDSAMCYIMRFRSYEEDSIVSILFNDCDYKGKYTGYKGMTKIDDYYIAVLDSENIGKGFYNSKLLINRDISEFKCSKGYLINGLFFKIKNNKIEFGGGCLNNDIP